MAAGSLRSSFAAAISSQADALGRFTIGNTVWLGVAGAVTVAGSLYVPAYVLGVLLVPTTCGVLRMAGNAVRGDRVALPDLGAGFVHRFWPHLLLGAGQLILLTIAAFNIGFGLAEPGLLPAIIAVISAYVAMAVCMVATAAWPLLLDPRRAGMRTGGVLRLALGVVMARPLGLATVALAVVALFALTAETILLAVVLPAYACLLATHYVLPVADELQPLPAQPGKLRSEPATDRSRSAE